MSCCPHPVERHAYNGCANCGCSMRWNEHPRRDFDTSLAGLEQNKTERDDIRTDRDRLSARVAELEAENDRLRHDGGDLVITLRNITRALNDAGWPSSALGVEDRAIGAIKALASVRAEVARIRPVYEAALALYETDQDGAMGGDGLSPTFPSTFERLSALYEAIDAATESALESTTGAKT